MPVTYADIFEHSQIICAGTLFDEPFTAERDHALPILGRFRPRRGVRLDRIRFPRPPGVTVWSGEMKLTRIPCSANSRAIVRVKLIIAALQAA